MTKKLTEKYNDACIKLFEFLKMLYDGNAEFKKVIDLFSNGQYDGKSNTHVTLNKYLNAMKIFGIKVKKINGKYKMLSSLYKIKFNLDDLKSIALLKDAYDILPEGKNKTNLEHFINSLEIRYDDSTQALKKITNTHNNIHIAINTSEMVNEIKQYEKFCQDKLKLEIIYTTEKGESINILCSPVELLYQKRKICLKTLGNNGSRVYEIPIENIQSIKQLPVSNSGQSIPTTIVYRIKNRLARNYKLRDWERLDKIEADGSHIIVNKNEDLHMLIKRLMRYGTECEICSPKFFKNEMIERINSTLENYK